MSKRSETIRSMFTAPPAPALSADNSDPAALPRVSSGSVRSLKDSFSGVERENETLREQIRSGSVMIEIDPTLVDPSPIADRFADANDASFKLLMASIRERGQQVPILVREHPTQSGRYQSAFGHRRVRVALELGRPLKAILRDLTDKDLVIAQGVENSARADLSFIERAIFAMRLEDAGHDRSVVQVALTVDRAEASKLLSVARSIPSDLTAAIGRAAKIGRGRWQSLSELLKDANAVKRARNATQSPGFTQQDSDVRFLSVFVAAGNADAADQDRAPSRGMVVSNAGRAIARVDQRRRETSISVDRGAFAGFADYLVEQLPGLFEAYLRHGQETTAEAPALRPATPQE